MGNTTKPNGSKSVLDGIPVDNRAYQPHFPIHQPLLGIVGNCPKCGAPIYGKGTVIDDDPCVKYTCPCRLPAKTTLDDLMHTK